MAVVDLDNGVTVDTSQLSDDVCMELLKDILKNSDDSRIMETIAEYGSSVLDESLKDYIVEQYDLIEKPKDAKASADNEGESADGE